MNCPICKRRVIVSEYSMSQFCNGEGKLSPQGSLYSHYVMNQNRKEETFYEPPLMLVNYFNKSKSILYTVSPENDYEEVKTFDRTLEPVEAIRVITKLGVML